ncbi:MAG: hypothetical protein ACOCWA_08870, partial [Bacteroidota bacterium]
MGKRKIIDSNRILHLETTKNVDSDILNHIKSAVLGTPGRLRYKLTKIEEKLDHIKDIDFIVLTRKGRILGSVGLIRRNAKAGDKDIRSWYVRYFFIKAPMRSGKQKHNKYRNTDRGGNLIRDAVMPYASQPSRLNENFDPGEKTLVYAYVESENIRSMNFSKQMNAITVRKYMTFIFNRIFLKRSEGIRRLENSEKALMMSKIKEFYSDYKLFTDENLFMKNDYFVLVEEGEIIAGAQVHPETWRIVNMKGRISKTIMKVLPRLPLARNFFNPDNFHFLALEGIWHAKGKEKLLNTLFEGICHHFNTHFILTWADTESGLAKALKQHLDYGVIGRTFDQNEVDVRLTFNNFTEEEKREFYDNPVY